jgi:CHASE1-domain containing sensor protein
MSGTDGRLSRRAASAALGLVVLAALWVIFVRPTLGALPADFRYEADVVAYDDWFDESSRVFSGPLKTESRLTCDRLDSGGAAATVDCRSQLISNSTDRPSFTVERRYAIDQRTWAHLADAGDADRPRGGYLFGHPDMEIGEAFTYWHPPYDAPAQMSYRGEEWLLGLHVYRYEANFGDEPIDQTSSFEHLRDVGVTRGVAVRPELEVWIEPTTGLLIKHVERGESYYYDLQTGKTIAPLDRYERRSSVLSVVNLVDRAEREIVHRLAWGWGPPILLLLAALAVTLWGCASCREEYRRRAFRWLPISVLFATIVAAAACSYTVHDALRRRSDSRMSADAAKISDAVFARLSVYANVLYGARGLFYASDSVARSEWAAYARSLNVRTLYPGVSGVGYSLLIPDWKLAAHEANVRAEGFRDYAVWPRTPARELYSATVFLEPRTEENLAALGEDMMAEPVRAAAMERARDEDAVAASGLVHLARLAGQDVDPGFVLFLPVYGPGDTATVEGRRDAVVGYAFSPFHSYRFAEDAIARNDYALRFEIFAGKEATRENRRLFDSDPTASLRASRWIQETVDVFGEPWTLRFSGEDGYGLSSFERSMPWLVFGAGLLFSALLYAALVTMARGRLATMCPPEAR